MSTVAPKEEIEISKKRISDAVAQARLRFETIINNHLFSAVMNRSMELGGFPPLRYLELLFSYAAKGTQEGKYNFDTLYQLIEVLSYFVYHCKIVMDAEAESKAFLPGQSANVRIQVKLAIEMFPQNLVALCNNTRLLLAYVTNLERTTVENPTYKQRPRLFKVEKLIFATDRLPEVRDFADTYNQVAKRK
ncbi:hypothetical protein P0082_09565 [Candidatus Haliotispira prima]|uniref:Uncharacterized protein n=1 Tax=Candidatus Haliotispira prima TaxID=3034016 RepID=A0ABY8MHT5_9SPIO|nr:hypothetical protein P0082_09565 [Candidatus Haliotispira prima]